MTGTLRRLLALAGAPRPGSRSPPCSASPASCFGAGLMATAGYLIVRAAEQPPILALTTAIVAVRFFGLGRPLARYLERLAGHDVALRALARVRTRVYERIEPLAPARLEGYADGDLLARAVADVDALQDLHPRVLIPPLVALGERGRRGRRHRGVPARRGRRARGRPARRRRRGPAARRPPAGALRRGGMPPPAPSSRSSSSSCWAARPSSPSTAPATPRWAGSAPPTGRSSRSPAATRSAAGSPTGSAWR